MKKFFKFLFKSIFIILILLLFVSYCSYDLFSKASISKLQNMGEEMFGSKVLINKELSDGEKFTLIIENPNNFVSGNMILLKNISQEINNNNKSIVLSGLTINYAINKSNQINLHVVRDNAKNFAEANLKNLDEINRLLEETDTNENSDNKTKNYIQSITFINPTLVLHVDNKYQGITTIPSFSLQYNNAKQISLLKGVLESVTYLTEQADKAVVKLINTPN